MSDTEPLRFSPQPKHGHSATTVRGRRASSTYNSWRAMAVRCSDPSCRNYGRYGARGITVCERWRKFENFLADMGERPKGTTLDRVNSNGNYDPGNCRWATPKSQARNRQSNRLLSFRGETRCATEWAELLGINRTTIERRLHYGWPIERALTHPVRPHQKVVRP
jgi:hypothetical protein